MTARELVVDVLARKMRRDPVAFRRDFLRDDRLRAVLDQVVRVGQWGRALPAGVAQGIALHAEYRGAAAVLVEIDCRPATVNRPVEGGVTGPRVTKATVVVDAGLPLNPRGIEAQMIGCLNDGIALALTSSLHIKDGIPLEGSWSNYFYTRQWNTPFEVEVVVLLATTGQPSGIGELGVAPSFAAVACAYARATGTVPTSFPVSHGTLGFEPFPLEPSTPQSPTDGCGINVCKSCTSHINGRAVNPCAVPVSKLKPTDEITTIEGLPATVGREITDDDLDGLRNICRCGTYTRIRDAIRKGAARR